MIKDLKLYYCNMDNFGDRLNCHIFEKCFGVKIRYFNSWECDSIGIGSILDKMLWQTKDINFELIKNIFSKNKEVIVLSSGLGFEDNYYLNKIRFFKTMKFKRRLKIVSLRGYLTKQAVEKILKTNLDDIIVGDLGILASYLLDDNNKIEKKYDLGICPHYADKDNPIFKKIQKENKNSIILDIQEDVYTFLYKLSQCKAIVSTGMHALIVADSLNIPNLWGRISDKTTSKHKFEDYYSIYGIKPKPYNLLEQNIYTEDIIKQYKINQEQVQQIKDKLLLRHRQFFEEN